MNITPADIMRCAARPEGIDDISFVLKRQSACAFFGNITAKPTPEDIAEAVAMMADYFEIETTEAELEAILTLYPQAAIGLAEWGADDTDIRGQIASAYSNLYLGCDWPTYGDNVDLDAFTAILKAQIERVRNPAPPKKVAQPTYDLDIATGKAGAGKSFLQWVPDGGAWPLIIIPNPTRD